MIKEINEQSYSWLIFILIQFSVKYHII